MDRVREMIAALQDGDNIGAEQAFKDAIAYKVGDALESKRQEVAKSFVTSHIPEEIELDEEMSDDVIKMVMKYGKSDEKARFKRYISMQSDPRGGLNPDQKRDRDKIIAVARGRSKA